MLFLPMISILLAPSTTQAGFFSWFSGQDALAQTETVIETNSQNMNLPEPATNINPSTKVTPTVIIDGGEAILSEVGPSTSAPERVESSNNQISVYIVRSGDTMAKIAEMFDVSVNTLLWANDMTKSSTLKIGQTLVILPISGVMHTVVSGDTLSTIAKKYGGDITEIAGFNDLKVTDKLAIGDTIMIPDGQASSSLRPSSVGLKTNSNTSPSYEGYYQKPFNGGTRTQGIHGYNAVDYGMPKNSSIFSAAPGKVLISKNSGWNGGYGNYIVIQHPNNTQTVYAHLTSSTVSVGQTVDRGELIGYSGNTGRYIGPTGQHLHFEIRGAKNPF